MADNSKYYQSLLDKGYTSEQIDSMINAVSSWQDAMQVVRNVNEGKSIDQPPVAWNVDMGTYKGTDANGNVTTWPLNANLNYNQYWDDSNPNQQSQKGWLNDKYTGEGTSNTYIAYNPNLRTSDLDPNYLYGQAAKDRNRQEAGYIARRNDQIASALYNEWRVSKEDVAQFLASQKEWMNSTEADRLNTIESVWKRLWQIKPQEEEPQKEYDPSIIENALDEDTSGKLYGKVTADTGDAPQWIDTLADANSVYKAMNEGRIANVKALISMKPSTVAASMADWINPYWLQAWRDVQQYYPEFAADVQQQLKKIQWQNTVNAITSWEEEATTSTDTMKKAIENDKETMATTYSSSTSETESIREDINTAMASNQSASEASETMDRLEKDMAVLKNRLKNLRTEANKIFKWDAPDYLVKAWMNNKTQEIQNQMSILEDRYNAAYQRYTTQLDQEWKDKQYDLQLKQFNLQKDQAGFNQWYQRQQLAKSNIVTDANGQIWKLNINDDGSVYYEKIEQVQTYSGSWMKWAWLKNNNPWNIKDSDFWNVLWHDERWFAKFATPEDWFDALVEKIIFNQTNPKSRYYGTTLLEYFQIYAPKWDWNDPIAYAQSVAKQLGVWVNTPIKDVDPVKLAAAIAKHDSGYDYSTYWQFRWNTTWWTTWTVTWWTTASSNFNIDDVEIPWSIFEDDERGMTIDPKSEEGQRRIKEYLAPYVMQNVDVTNTSYNQWPLADDNITPIAYRQRIYQLVPWQLKNNVAELENLYTTARLLYQAGYTADQAALTFYWLDLKNDQTWLMQSLVDLARSAWADLSDEFYWNLGSFTERWLTWAAISMIENEILPKEDRKQIAEYNAMLMKIQNVRKALDKLDSMKTWPITWKLSKLSNKYFKSNEDFQEVSTAIDVAFSQLRNTLLWTTLPEATKNLYENRFPTTDDFYDNILVKLKESEIWILEDINSIRNTYMLPSVDLEAALNPSLRLALYKSMLDVFN